jgi:hypothetical protein
MERFGPYTNFYIKERFYRGEFLCTSEVLNLSVLDIHGILYNCCMHLGSAGFFHFEADSGFQDFLHSRSRR